MGGGCCQQPAFRFHAICDICPGGLRKVIFICVFIRVEKLLMMR
jgi:hypothetical protein